MTEGSHSKSGGKKPQTTSDVITANRLGSSRHAHSALQTQDGAPLPCASHHPTDTTNTGHEKQSGERVRGEKKKEVWKNK